MPTEAPPWYEITASLDFNSPPQVHWEYDSLSAPEPFVVHWQLVVGGVGIVQENYGPVGVASDYYDISDWLPCYVGFGVRVETAGHEPAGPWFWTPDLWCELP